MKQFILVGICLLSVLNVDAQDKWIEFLDFQLRAEGGLHALFLPSRQNISNSSNSTFADTSLFNPGIHLKLVAAPLAHKNFGISGFWERMYGYALSSGHAVKSRGFEAYVGSARFQAVYGRQTIERQVYLNSVSYNSSTSVDQLLGGSVYDGITRNQFGLRINPNSLQRLDLSFFSEYWPARDLNYIGYGLSFLGANGWQFSGEVIPAHPVIGFNFTGVVPPDIKSESLMFQLKITRHFVYNSNYRKVWKYGP